MIKEAHNIDMLKFAFKMAKEEYIDKGVPCYIKIDKLAESVSQEQQRYYYGVILPMVLGHLKDRDIQVYGSYDVDDVDFLLRDTFYYKHLIVKGKKRKVPKRLAFGKANKEAVSMYFDQIITSMAGIGLEIPEAEERKK